MRINIDFFDELKRQGTKRAAFKEKGKSKEKIGQASIIGHNN